MDENVHPIICSDKETLVNRATHTFPVIPEKSVMERSFCKNLDVTTVTRDNHRNICMTNNQGSCKTPLALKKYSIAKTEALYLFFFFFFVLIMSLG